MTVLYLNLHYNEVHCKGTVLLYPNLHYNEVHCKGTVYPNLHYKEVHCKGTVLYSPFTMHLIIMQIWI